MKRVLLVTTSFPASVPGSEAAGGFVADFAAALARHASVSVLAPSTAAGSVRNGEVDVVRFRVPRLPLSLLSPFHIGDWGAIARTLRGGAAACDRAVAELRPDHVLALWALPSGHWARRASRRHRIPYSVWALGSDIWSLGRLPVVRSLLRSVLKGADALFADGEGLCAEVQKLSGRPCEFLPSARQMSMGARKGGHGPPYRLAFLGRWHPNKGVDLMLQSLESLGDGDWSRIDELRIAGGGPLADSVLAQAGRLRARGRPVSTLGYLDREAAAALLSWADFLLIPSRVESVPVVFSDAMQCRCPVVVCPVGDLPSLVGRFKVGIVADAVTSAAFGQAVQRAVGGSPEDFRTGMDAAAAAFSIDRIAHRFARTVGIAD